MQVTIGDHCLGLSEHPNVWMPTQFGLELGELLLSRVQPGSKVLELGVGSGLLIILAAQLGASTVTGLDINHEANTLALQNCANNKVLVTVPDLRCSDLFSAMRASEEGTYDLIWSNPPTFPGNPPDHLHRSSRDEWEFAGDDGRVVLDAILTQGARWLKPGKKMVTIATSRQGWSKTMKLLDEHWSSWTVLKEVDLPLAEYYFPYINQWTNGANTDLQYPRIFQRSGQWYQRLYFIEGTKVA